MIETQGICQQLMEHLRDTLEEDLTQLNRGVQMSQREVHKSIFAANERFQSACQKFQNLRTQLQRLSKDLCTHEGELQESK